MTDNAKKISELATANTIANSDRLVFLYQANSSAPSVRTITATNFANNIAISGLRNSNATMTLANTGIVTVQIGNNTAQIGDVEQTNSLDFYVTGNNGNWISLTYGLNGSTVATEYSNTAYAFLYGYNSANVTNTIPDSAGFSLQIPSSNNTLSGFAVWSFQSDMTYGTVDMTFPDGTKQTTAYKIHSGPYSNHGQAAAGGVPINGLYYDSQGHVLIRLE